MKEPITKYKYLFGPVPSRRLGLSLGVDLVPKKVCSLDCVYCEVKKTDKKTIKQAEWVPAASVITELGIWLESGVETEYITFSGYGEPTLNNKIKDIIDYLKKRTATPLALLTNSTLFSDPKVRERLLDLDVVLPSLDAANQKIFRLVNRPVPSLDIKEIIEGLVRFRKEYPGKIWLEILLVDGLNDQENHLEELARAIDRIKPDQVQLNTVARPGSEEWAKKACLEVLDKAVGIIGKSGTDVKAIADFRPGNADGNAKNRHAKTTSNTDRQALAERVLEIVSRRPETVENLAASLSEDREEIAAVVAGLVKEEKIVEVLEHGKRFVKHA
ncbi:MAG: radical SAM protein [Deltaproteobacteria bacterium]|nr:radical SAM protein [Deltaproteobacteria bacterium]